MFLQRDFEDPFEFARLIQTCPELVNLIEALLKFRKLLDEHNQREGLKMKLAGFTIIDSGIEQSDSSPPS